MTTCVYPSYRAIGRPIEFGGLEGPYILLAAAAVIADLLLFVILYCCGTPPWVCLVIAFGSGAGAVVTAKRLSQRFGAHGLRKHFIAKRLPQAVRLDSRKPFLNLINPLL